MILPPSDSNLMLCPCTCWAQPGYWSASSSWVTKRIFFVLLWCYKLLLHWTLSEEHFCWILGQVARPLSQLDRFTQHLRVLRITRNFYFLWDFLAIWKQQNQSATTLTYKCLIKLWQTGEQNPSCAKFRSQYALIEELVASLNNVWNPNPAHFPDIWIGGTIPFWNQQSDKSTQFMHGG